MRLKVLRVAMNGEEAPHNTITKAFEKRFELETIWWERLSVDTLNQFICQHVTSKQYNIVFMQIQRPNVITAETWATCAREAETVFNWTGDVRTDLGWYMQAATNGIITLFTNKHDVALLNDAKLRADYLQVGYDNAIYMPCALPIRDNDIVFCANHYEGQFPLSDYRKEIAEVLCDCYGERFKLFGRGWEPWRNVPHLTNKQEAEQYQQAAIVVSVSHFNYDSYFSDRLLRAMACGALVLSHRFENCESLFENYKHVVYFDNIDELLRIINYYIVNKKQNAKIGNAAADIVARNYTWDAFCKNLEYLYFKYNH